MTIIAVLGWLPVVGVAAGLTRAKFRRLPLMVAALAVAAYLITMVSFAVWAAPCWDCKAGLSETRGDVVIIFSMFFGVYLALTLVGIWLGARFSGSLARLIATFREARTRMGPGPPAGQG